MGYLSFIFYLKHGSGVTKIRPGSFIILNLDLGQDVKESARPNFRHLNRPCFNKGCSFNTFPLWVKVRGNQNQEIPVSNSSHCLSFFFCFMSKAQDGQCYEVIRNFKIMGIMLFTYNVKEKNLKP